MRLSDYTPVFCDVETFVDTKADYSLRKMSMVEYIRDERFKLHGFGFASGRSAPSWAREHEFITTGDESPLMFVGHNAKFDAAILAWRYGIKFGCYMDTMGLAMAVLGEKVSSFSLKKLADYLGLPNKGEMKTDGIRDLDPLQEMQLEEYCLNDVELCRSIYYKLIGEFPESQLSSMDWTIRAFIEPKLKLNTEILERGLHEEKERREKAINASGYSKAELSSSSTFQTILGSSCPIKTSDRTGKSIPALALQDEGFLGLRDTVPVLYAARVAAKSTITETRAAKLLEISKTGLWPFDVKFSGAVQTHRYSGGSGAGGNPQNLPKSGFIRESVQGGEGCSLVVGDFAAIELRIIATLAGDIKLRESLRDGDDIYCEFATEFYKRRVTVHDKVERTFGKTAILGLGYGMGAAKFCQTVFLRTGQKITLGEAQKAVALYRSMYPRVPQLWRNAQSLLGLLNSGMRGQVFFAPFLRFEKEAVILPSGLKIRYPHLRRDGKEWTYQKWIKKSAPEAVKIYGGKVIENICQGLAGDICKLSIEGAIGKGLSVAGAVHDEIIAVVSSSRRDEAVSLLRDVMCEPPSWWPQIPISAEVKYGENWSEAKEG